MRKSYKRSQHFLERLHEGVLLGDGAMGTQLYQAGVPLEANFEYLNLVQPDLVLEVHRAYAAAGAEILETNTFGANALKLGEIGLERKVASINEAGARLARKVAGDERFVAGAVGPLNAGHAEEAALDRTARRAVLREQMEALAEGGVDLFMLETFAFSEDLILALEVARSLGLPAVAQMAFLEGGRTRGGIDAESAARLLEEAGAAVIGANCGSGPRELLQVIERLAAATQKPLSAYPNSGFPQYVDGRYMYLATPDYFAARGVEMVQAGASLVGGCCGTGPEHIRALRGRLEGLRPAPRKARMPRAAEPSAPQIVSAPRGRLLDAWGSRTVVTVELDPPRGLDTDKVLDGARKLAAAGVDAISLAENPLARIRMGNIALAQRIQQDTGLEAIVHVTGRDRNLIGLHSELMGAHLLGIRTVLAVTGDPVSVGGESGATSVFDLNSIGLLELISALNEGRNLLGAELGGQSAFLAGAAFNPNVPDMSGQLRKLARKVAAGAHFVQTQPIYSAALLKETVERTADMGIPVLIGILPMVSERNAEFLHNEVPGIRLPDEIRKRMKGKRGEEGVREGLTIARELIEAGRGLAGGFYLMPPFGKVDIALELVGFIRRG